MLVGFMAAGKTIVGRLLADRLGWRFVDVDAQIEAACGMGIAEIFAHRGEAVFRDTERTMTAQWLRESDVVIATGGGWAARPDAITGLPDSAMAVWLRVSVAESVRRAGNSGRSRPLLDVEDPIRAAAELLQRRESFYELADMRVDVDGREPDDIAATIEAGWRVI